MVERFEMERPRVGKPGTVEVGESGLLIGHSLVKGPLTIAYEDVAWVVRITHTGEDVPVLRRDPTLLELPATGTTESNVFLVLSAPVRTPRFMFGADQMLPISGRQRRRGLEVEGLGLTLADPDGFAASMARRRVRTTQSISEALVDAFGRAEGPELEARLHELEGGRRVRTAKLVLLSMVWVAAIAARIGLEATGTDTVGLVVSSLAWMAVTAYVVSGFVGEGRRRPVRDKHSTKGSLVMAAVVVGMALVPLLAAVLLADQLGVPRMIAFGLVGGLPGGFVLGFGLAIQTPTRAGA